MPRLTKSFNDANVAQIAERMATAPKQQLSSNVITKPELVAMLSKLVADLDASEKRKSNAATIDAERTSSKLALERKVKELEAQLAEAKSQLTAAENLGSVRDQWIDDVIKAERDACSVAVALWNFLEAKYAAEYGADNYRGLPDALKQAITFKIGKLGFRAVVNPSTFQRLYRLNRETLGDKAVEASIEHVGNAINRLAEIIEAQE